MEHQKENEKKITISDVAEALGVSKTTVSRAISGKGRIGAETRERVLTYIKEHNYKPNALAKGLAQLKTYNIGVVLPEDYTLVDLPFFQTCLMGISEVAVSMDYDILLTMGRENENTQLMRMVENHKVDGIILMRTFTKDQSVEYLKKTGIPFVTIGSTNYPEVIQVDNDHKNACRELISILLMKKMQRIGIVGGIESHVVTQSRLQGYIEAYENAGLTVDKSIIHVNADREAMIERAVEKLLGADVDCIVCLDDAVCMQVLNKLRKENIRVPEDMKVASFYDSSVLENHMPSITSLSFNVRELGMTACRTVLDMIEGKKVARRTLLGYEVILKESTK
ncbi:LacI family DNA-binding transcriptional regulator [Roseburia sp. 499]|uniref:LacI family DNA-binding transcriptional regulator n=1 Tax=Roseburia sp. 499 TaxID=1261634 RepID=UPI000951EF5F|nr:LacI family DNA-binding transcriptional regulator [Roseburia sp. 499]WVK68932.1 LacI family DNA-binding transcriptional regulator [Roseburia sp. 499]